MIYLIYKKPNGDWETTAYKSYKDFIKREITINNRCGRIMKYKDKIIIKFVGLERAFDSYEAAADFMLKTIRLKGITKAYFRKNRLI